MSSLIVYGSLMSLAELERQGFQPAAACPVTVMGFRRSFSQEPSWRLGSGNKRGVLTVVADDSTSINAILVSRIPASAFVTLDDRERGYNRIIIRGSQIHSFANTQIETIRSDAFIYAGRPHKINASLEPNPEYLKLCLDAASEWGDEFCDVFRRTTFVSTIPLNE